MKLYDINAVVPTENKRHISDSEIQVAAYK